MRDYGTGEWEGGDENCDHETPRSRAEDTEGWKQSTSAGSRPNTQHVCKCGAQRVDQQLGLEPTPDAYVQRIVEVFREVRRVLARHGTCFINLGDSYNNRNMSRLSSHQGGLGFDSDDLRKSWVELKAEGRTRMSIEDGDLKEKDLVGVPWMVAFALRADGWYLRSDIIWAKPNPMPESVTDRPTKAHEYVFLLTKQARYYFDAEAVREPHKPDGRHVTTRTVANGSHANYQEFGHEEGRERWPNGGRNIRSVWEIATQPFTSRALGDDSFYKVSEDCPRHGLAAAPRNWQKAARGEPLSRRDYRIDSSDARRALGLDDEFASSFSHSQTDRSTPETRTPESSDGSRTHGALSFADGQASGAETPPRSSRSEDPGAPVADSSGSAHPERSPSATARNTGSRKTGRAPATTPPCTPSAETPARTDDTSTSPESDEQFGRTHESSTATVDSSEGQQAETGDHTARKCTCVKVTTDHFATFPTELVRRAILAGCPVRVCRVCGKPSERIVEKELKGGHAVPNARPFVHGKDGSAERGSYAGASHVSGHYEVTTLGWSDCGHNDWRPGVTLDPFLGSGTTALVARNHGRHAIGIELSPEYAELAARRTRQLSLLT